MKPNAGRTAVAVLSGALFLLTGCPSAYQRTYEQETQRLQMQQRAADAEAQAAHAQASKYAAVCYFAVGSAALDEDTLRQLGWFVQQMQPYPQAMIQVQGFADSTGSEATNAGLSLERATAVTSYLNSQGIAPPRIVTQGFGEQYAAQSNETAQGRRNNRRVEVTVR
jgi:outer membrane protein OmpA-like peptidoglycan-associated protein